MVIEKVFATEEAAESYADAIFAHCGARYEGKPIVSVEIDDESSAWHRANDRPNRGHVVTITTN